MENTMKNRPAYKLQKWNFVTNKWEKTGKTFATRVEVEGFLGMNPEFDNHQYRVMRMSAREKTI